MIYASMKVNRSQNTGDQIQILAADQFLPRIDMKLDRDCELQNCKKIQEVNDKITMIMNGWFKLKANNKDPQWPPHKKINPLFIGFHIRPRFCQKLLTTTKYYNAHSPIGCRDNYTLNQLSALGIKTWLSYCVSMTFPERTDRNRNKIVISSKTNIRNIRRVIPRSLLKNSISVSHYVKKNKKSNDAFKRQYAKEILDLYRDAKLVITTFLHAALPCIGMGVPVVVLKPLRGKKILKNSDDERFSGIKDLTKIYSLNSPRNINWEPEVVDCTEQKDKLIRTIKSFI